MLAVKDDNISVTDLVKPCCSQVLDRNSTRKDKIHQVDQIVHHDRTKEAKDLIYNFSQASKRS